jgi:CMP-N,N'-diacetyllegionaminic acid synthase
VSLRVLAVVPARGGSRRVPRKNLAVLGGRTLVRRALDTALAARCFAGVALSSEDPAILREAAGLPEVVPIERPPALATHTARSYDVVLHAVETLERTEPPYDAVAIVQCTSPFTAPEDLAGAVAQLEASEADSVVSVARVDAALHPLKLKRLEGDRLLPFLEDDDMTPSHELPPLWLRNGSIYVSRREVIAQGRIVGDDVRGYEMPPERSLDVDTPTDLAFAEFLLQRGRRLE